MSIYDRIEEINDPKYIVEGGKYNSRYFAENRAERLAIRDSLGCKSQTDKVDFSTIRAHAAALWPVLKEIAERREQPDLAALFNQLPDCVVAVAKDRTCGILGYERVPLPGSEGTWIGPSVPTEGKANELFGDILEGLQWDRAILIRPEGIERAPVTRKHTVTRYIVEKRIGGEVQYLGTSGLFTPFFVKAKVYTSRSAANTACSHKPPECQVVPVSVSIKDK